MRALPSLAALAVAAALSLFASSPSRAAMDAAERARRNQIVARVGPVGVTAGELEDRLNAVPRYQLTSFGNSPGAIRHNFLDQIIVPEVLYSLAGEAEHLDTELPTSARVTRALSDATMAWLKKQIGPAPAIPMEEVEAYFEANRARYDTPERYGVWRVLCRTREEAQAVLDAAKKDPSIPTFNALARDHSIDKATNQRGGNMGFVTLDGTSSEAGLHIDPLIVKAAAAVKSGELVPQPVPEGTNFAVVWHKQTVPAVHRRLQEVAAQIRNTLRTQHEEQMYKSLVAGLRAQHLTEENEAVLNGIEVASADGVIEPRHRPGQAPPLNPNQALPR
jgi:peptidyl-prolyl cis-trans isomerase C